MSNSEKDEGSNGNAPELLGDVAKIADAKVITLLLGRSAKATGDYLGEKIEGYFKRKKEEAQRKNVSDHVKRVVEVVGEPDGVMRGNILDGTLVRQTASAPCNTEYCYYFCQKYSRQESPLLSGGLVELLRKSGNAVLDKMARGAERLAP